MIKTLDLTAVFSYIASFFSRLTEERSLSQKEENENEKFNEKPLSNCMNK
ncbi:MAG TPA: hypothetical protein HA261_03040 [Methanosarcina sp.]|nr:hypothetical protein [Methanosarcina sp.]